MSLLELTLPPSLGRESTAELLAAVGRARNQAPLKALVLRGSATAFCRGLDFAELQSGEALAESSRIYTELLLALRRFERPVISVVEGPALGGGVGIAAASDLVLASAEASFGFPEVMFGFAPGMILPLVLERMRPQTARLWMLTGTTHTAEEAQAAGLVDVVTDGAELPRELKRWLRKLGRAHPRGVATVKTLSMELPRLELGEAVERGRESTASALEDPGVRAGIRAFQEDGILPWETV
jgi:enoyl-CoA hydratase/carnithine racemase